MPKICGEFIKDKCNVHQVIKHMVRSYNKLWDDAKDPKESRKITTVSHSMRMNLYLWMDRGKRWLGKRKTNIQGISRFPENAALKKGHKTSVNMKVVLKY